MLRRVFLRSGLARRAAADRQGLAAIEFAMLAPLLIMLYFGLAELSAAIIASRHTSHATSSLGDLVSQCSNVNDSDLSNMFNAAGDIMAPLSPATLSQTISSVAYNGSGSPQVQWSLNYNGGSSTVSQGLTPGSSMTVPANVLNTAGDTVIVTETVYTYKFPFTPTGSTVPMGGQPLRIDFANGISFDDLSYFKPRKSTQVGYTGTTGAGGSGTQTSCYTN